MNDYKELLSRIAYCTNEESCDGCPLDSDNILCYCVDELLRKASNAIEQLCAEVARLEAENRAKEQYIAETIGKVIKERDTAMPVVHGKWFDGECDDGGELWYCSRCNYPVKTIAGRPAFDYCPHCGAEMDGGEANENKNL